MNITQDNDWLDDIANSAENVELANKIKRKGKAKSKLNTKIHIADFETSTGNDDGTTNVYLWGISDMSKEDRYIGVNLEEFFKTINHYKLSKIAFHNLKFDGQFILHYITNEGYEWVDSPFQKPKTPKTFTWMKDDTGVTYSLIVNTGDTIIEFTDTARLLVSSVERMGKMMGLPKLEIDYDLYKQFDTIEDVPDKLVEYLWRDIDVVIERFSQFKQSYPNHGITAAGTSLKSFKKVYGASEYIRDFGGYYNNKGKQEVRNVLTVEQWELFKTGYWGGYVWVNLGIKGIELRFRRGESADFNSMYPSMMEAHRFPVGSPMEVRPYGDNIITFHQIYIEKATLKDEKMFPIIPSNYSKSKFNTKYLSEVSQEYYNIFDVDLENWLKYYDMEYRVIKEYYFRSEYVFTEWVGIYKKLKEEAKNDVEKDDAKIALNSLYGKFAQKYLRLSRVLEKDPFHTEPGVRYGNDYVEAKAVTESELLSYMPIGAYITALSRRELFNAIYLNRDGALYADTDSVYSSKPIVGLKIHNTKLGYWKYEKAYTRFKAVKPKAYIADMIQEYKGGKWVDKTKIAVACAGLSTENHHLLNFETFYSGNTIENGKMVGKNVEGGVVLKTQNYTI